MENKMFEEENVDVMVSDFMVCLSICRKLQPVFESTEIKKLSKGSKFSLLATISDEFLEISNNDEAKEFCDFYLSSRKEANEIVAHMNSLDD